MKKTKKITAILCVVINIILFTQVCFGSVSAFYDAVMSNEVEDQHICNEDELQAESVCTQEQLENTRCAPCPHNMGWEVTATFKDTKCWVSDCTSTTGKLERCKVPNCLTSRIVCGKNHIKYS